MAQSIEKLEAERDMLLARLRDVLPYVGVCPLLPQAIHEMSLLKDLAIDAVVEVEEHKQKRKVTP